MAIAIAADPRAEAHARQRAGLADHFEIQVQLGPSLAEALIELRQDGREDLAQVVQNVAALVFERRLFEQDFAGAPEPLERGFDGIAANARPRKG